MRVTLGSMIKQMSFLIGGGVLSCGGEKREVCTDCARHHQKKTLHNVALQEQEKEEGMVKSKGKGIKNTPFQSESALTPGRLDV